ncbi:MAG: A24 family peptidase [Gammaproteobacteria bacterium]
MVLTDALQITPWLVVSLAAVLGLLVGSFLNVVIYRLPVMMQREWRTQCAELLQTASEPALPRFDLSTPRSRCPACNHAITAFENIPVISYLVLRGKCSACSKAISPRYPSIEILTGILSAIVAAHFGFGWMAGAALILTWALIALSFIDVDHQLLPDSITLPFLWGGLALSLVTLDGNVLFANSHDAIIGAFAGYLSLWSVYWLFKLLTGKEGMGHGDFKLLAMLGAWLGWQALPVIILMSSLVGAVAGIGMILIRGRDRNLPIPFGPYLALAGWITLLWGKDITHAYLTFAGLT